MRKLVMFVASLGLVMPLFALASEAWTTAAPAAPKSVTVSIVQRVRFQPPTWGFDQMSITIPPGTTVTWKSVPGNSDSHTSTSNDEAWNSPLLNPGETWSFTFSKAGQYRYHCALHSWMVGVINVVAGASTPPTTPAPTSK